MFLWIESQNSTLIALLVLALCYIPAALVLVAAAAASRRPIAADLRAVSPAMLTPLSAVTALLIVFLAARVWSNVDHANAYVTREASAIRVAVVLADTLPGDVGSAVRGGVGEYLRFIEAEDWPAMAEGRAVPRRAPPGINDALAALLAFTPSRPGEHVAQQRAVASIEQTLEARQNRIALSRAVISTAQWAVVFGLDVLILLAIAAVHVDRPVTAAACLFGFSTAMAACLMLLMINDRPFAAGGNTVGPAALREVGIDLR